MKTHLLSASVAVMLVWGCGGDGPTPPPAPSQSISVEVPNTVSIFSTAPGNTASLPVTVKDAQGSTMVSGFTKSFSSDKTAIATVTSDGTVTAVSGGTASITTAVTSGGVTVTKATAVTVTVPAMAESVSTPTLAFYPVEVHVSVGGTVTWSIGETPHTINFSTAGAPNSIPLLQRASDSRTFNTPGSFDYICTIHAGMHGTVVVH